MTSKETFPLSSKWYIHFSEKVYTFWRKGIYVLSEYYIRF